MESIGAFLPLILIFGVFYILLIRPQQKKVRQHRDMLNNLRRGDKIITSGGIIGTIVKVLDNRELIIQIAENVEIKIAPGMIADLYIVPEKDKANTSQIDKKESKSGLLSGFFGAAFTCSRGRGGSSDAGSTQGPGAACPACCWSQGLRWREFIHAAARQLFRGNAVDFCSSHSDVSWNGFKRFGFQVSLFSTGSGLVPAGALFLLPNICTDDHVLCLFLGGYYIQ